MQEILTVSSKEYIKPEYFFHGSPHKGLPSLQPRNTSVRNFEEGSVVFASPYIALATYFLVKTDDEWASIGRLGTDYNDPFYIIIGDEQRFRTLDHGGAIYHVHSAPFTSNPLFGDTPYEWTCPHPIKPQIVRKYDSALLAMIQHRVQVYIVPREMFTPIMRDDMFRYYILRHHPSINDRLGLQRRVTGPDPLNHWKARTTPNPSIF